MLDGLRRDIAAAMERDPAARSRFEVLLCYPGVHALALHRVSHRLWTRGWVVAARFVSHLARFLTGIEIHPAARIAPGVFIDHGMGVVIGETAEVAENVTLYQGVTLGGTSLKREKRHPTLERNTVVGAGAAILGGITLGEGTRVGAGSVVVRDVPANSVVVGVPGKVIYRDGQRVLEGIDLEHADLPDPMAKAMEQVLDRLHALEREVVTLRRAVGDRVPVSPPRA
jgi:serine O-acetyltransferase